MGALYASKKKGGMNSGSYVLEINAYVASIVIAEKRSRRKQGDSLLVATIRD